MPNDPEKTKSNLNLDSKSSFFVIFITNDIQIGLQKLTIACNGSHRTRQLKICPPNMSEFKVSCLFNYVQYLKEKIVDIIKYVCNGCLSFVFHKSSEARSKKLEKCDIKVLQNCSEPGENTKLHDKNHLAKGISPNCSYFVTKYLSYVKHVIVLSRFYTNLKNSKNRLVVTKYQ